MSCRIKQGRTDWPIDSFHLAQQADAPFREVGVYGFDGEHKELKNPVGDITEIPNVRMTVCIDAEYGD